MITHIIRRKLKLRSGRSGICIRIKNLPVFFSLIYIPAQGILADEFADSLNLLDSLILLEIYPARELPIEGVTAEIIWIR